MTSRNDPSQPPQSVDDYLKEIGGPTKWDTGGAATSAPAAASAGPSDDQLDFEQRAGKGVAKSLAATATGLPRLANAAIGLVSPSLQQKLGDLAERVPGVRRMEDFAAEPSTSWAETAGNIGGEATQFLAGPGEFKWGAKLASKFPKATFAGRGAGFVPTPRPWVHAIGSTAEGAVRGGVVGAATDPEDPGAGAAVGAATGGAVPFAGKALQSKVGQWVAGMTARHGPLVAMDTLAAHLGVPSSWLWNTGFAQLFLWHHAPFGRVMQRGGSRAARGLGSLLERADPRIPGALGGSLGDLAEQHGPVIGQGEDEAAPAEAE